MDNSLGRAERHSAGCSWPRTESRHLPQMVAINIPRCPPSLAARPVMSFC